MAKESFFQTPAFHYALLFSVIATLLLSIYLVISIYQLKSFIIPKPLDVDDLLKKLTAHPEMKNYAGITPSNIVQITSANLGNLQSQIRDIDVSFIGDFIVQYSDRLAVYDYINDTFKGSIVQPQLPQDFYSKLNKHPEMKSLQGQQPVGGGQLDAQTLNDLKQQSPEIYKNAQAGNYVLRYQSKIIIYDYEKDKIVNIASVE